MFYQCKQKSCRKRQCQYKNTLLINVLIALCCWFGWMMDGHFRQAGLFGIALSEVPCVKHALVWPVPPGNLSVFRWFQARACAGVRAALLLGRYPHVWLVPMPVRASGFLACLPAYAGGWCGCGSGHAGSLPLCRFCHEVSGVRHRWLQKVPR